MLRSLLDNRLLFKFILVISLIIISALAFMKGVDSPLKNDKLEHFAAFASLAFIAHHATRAGFGAQLFLLLGYGAWIELVQYFLPYRTSAVNDFMADISGVCTYHACYQVYEWMRQNRLVPA